MCTSSKTAPHLGAGSQPWRLFTPRCPEPQGNFFEDRGAAWFEHWLDLDLGLGLDLDRIRGVSRAARTLTWTFIHSSIRTGVHFTRHLQAAVEAAAIGKLGWDTQDENSLVQIAASFDILEQGVWRPSRSVGGAMERSSTTGAMLRIGGKQGGLLRRLA
ncbi:hypothetical protein CORC01_04335 [Colletotrichum orchidophilum]|uniref:Uncharacterized protein n=1 Tax=Colletotrichum orchidophilum TaxID=1209926 RepID=A0A1G4BG38_9PEZI|nr:uncharacterized protein CORC01_04335 [Colletotrichum orchidophilum]OHF00354.1 hypothetical protein CORC01_04335 [Colletotrichum orchidophilum]